MHCYIAKGTDNKDYWCIDFTLHELKIWYDNKPFIERMTKTYLPSKEEMILALPHLAEVL
jgi:hypothetical protein